jgi:hypothetical protein
MIQHPYTTEKFFHCEQCVGVWDLTVVIIITRTLHDSNIRYTTIILQWPNYVMFIMFKINILLCSLCYMPGHYFDAVEIKLFRISCVSLWMLFELQDSPLFKGGKF